MRVLIFAFFGIAALASLSSAQSVEWDEASVKQYCADEWQGDFSMEAYCIDTNKQGHVNFIRLLEKSDLVIFERPFSNCQSEWGIQWDMVTYCANQQIDGYQSLDSKVHGLPADVGRQILDRCAGEWRDDFNMVSYCADRQSSAWKKLNN